MTEHAPSFIAFHINEIEKIAEASLQLVHLRQRPGVEAYAIHDGPVVTLNNEVAGSFVGCRFDFVGSNKRRPNHQGRFDEGSNGKWPSERKVVTKRARPFGNYLSVRPGSS